MLDHPLVELVKHVRGYGPIYMGKREFLPKWFDDWFHPELLGKVPVSDRILVHRVEGIQYPVKGSPSIVRVVFVEFPERVMWGWASWTVAGYCARGLNLLWIVADEARVDRVATVRNAFAVDHLHPFLPSFNQR